MRKTIKGKWLAGGSAVAVIAALFQRWKEIQGGEEDEAKQY